MANQPPADEDDWVKQMLAEAMLGGAAGAKAPTESPADPLESEPLIESEPVTETDWIETGPLIETDGTDVGDVTVQPFSDAPFTAEPISVDHVAVEHGPGEAPPPALVSRLFERPSFDATNDPGVDELLSAERSSAGEIVDIQERTRLRGAAEWLVVLGSAVIVALLLRAFLFQAFFIPSESMEATLLVDDRVLVNKLSYRFGDVQRGEVVVFRRPDEQAGEFRDLIKRVIGLPGETIEARDNTIYIDGLVLIEPYLTPGEVIGDFDPVQIPEGEFFVMGDNRDNSGDSRVFGTIEEDLLIGRAFFLFWPIDRIGSL